MTDLLEPEAPVSSGSLFPIEDSCWIPKQRYLDRQFFDAERERLWPRVWQMACRLEEIPAVGDYVEYKISDLSVLLVRHGPGANDIKAFHNVCPHRATQLALGSGRSGVVRSCARSTAGAGTSTGRRRWSTGRRASRPSCVTDSELALHECLVVQLGRGGVHQPGPRRPTAA